MITAITIEREMMAHRFGMRQETTVLIHRNGKSVKSYSTNPMLPRKGKISDASVIRAKRAQLKLMEQDDRTDDDGQMGRYQEQYDNYVAR